MRGVPHAVSSAIMTNTDQQRRNDCRAGRMLREEPRRHDRGRQSEREEHRAMLAVHEHEALERRAWLSTEAREALPFLSALDDHNTRGPTLAHDDDVFSALTLDEHLWEEPDTAGPPVEEDPTS